MKPLLFLFLWTLTAVAADSPKIIRVGSKSFTESYVLAEIVAQTIENAGEAQVERKFGLGQTGIAFAAIRTGQIDLYPEYSGTLSEVLLKKPGQDIPTLRAHLSSDGLTVSDSLGFNNTYALAIPGKLASTLGIKTISDLTRFPSLRAGFSHEFLERKDCYPKIRDLYGVEFKSLQGLAHGLAYEALERGEIDVTDIYSTDAKVTKFGLQVLEDDKKAFPDYLALILARQDATRRFPKSWRALQGLMGSFSAKEISQLNARAEIEGKSFREIARDFIANETGQTPRTKETTNTGSSFWKLTGQHLFLVGVSLLAAILMGIPLGILAARSVLFGQAVLILTGMIQTVPSLALLCFLIPPFGIGLTPALIALFLYSLLPIVRGTHVGLTSVDPRLLEVAEAMGLKPLQRMVRIEIPLASRSLLGGIKTSAIINVGTATLAALIGAGGYGVPIVTGLALNDNATILQGAIPAAGMALAFHGIFELIDRLVIPRGLRVRSY